MINAVFLTVMLAQGLERFDVHVDLSDASRASVQIQMRVTGVPQVQYSLVPADIDEVEETVRECGGEQGQARSVATSNRMFPAHRTTLLSECSEVRLTYAVRNPGRIPLFVPDVNLGASSFVNIQVSSPVPPTADTFPRLEWNGGNGRRQMRHVPSFVHVPLGESPLLSLNAIANIVTAGVLLAGLVIWRKWRRPT